MPVVENSSTFPCISRYALFHRGRIFEQLLQFIIGLFGSKVPVPEPDLYDVPPRIMPDVFDVPQIPRHHAAVPVFQKRLEYPCINCGMLIDIPFIFRPDVKIVFGDMKLKVVLMRQAIRSDRSWVLMAPVSH